MGSTTTQPQFRLTQPPSKVLHLRNLPWECTEEELIELCKPFGKIVNTKCNVGANRNQAFVEFADQNQAIQMVSYYASSPEPAQVRGKTVYIQYSNRHEIVNNKSAGDEASNVLLVTIEGVEAGDVSIDVLHLVFSAFGFVHKITTFEKSAGFQALVQFSDIQTATSARDSLDGRSIPRYLLADHVGPCHLRISFSAHKDLNVKFQSHRSRDYTNPNLPVAPSALDGTGLFVIGPDGQRKELESNVLLATFENMQYAVNVDVLYSVFSAFGSVKKISIFDKNQSTQALIQYADISTAMIAKEALEGHCIYEGGYCKLHLSYSRHTDLTIKVNNDRSRDYTIPTVGIIPGHAPLLGQATSLPPVSGTAVPAAPSAYSGQQFVLPSQTVPVTQTTGSAYQRPMPNTMYAASVAETAPYGSPLQPYAGQALLPSVPYPSMSSPASAPMQVSSPYIGNIASNVPLVSGSTTSNVAFSSVPYNR